MGDLYFIPDDKFKRFAYAQFLETIITNCDNYKREASNSSYVIAVDSAWGTGKSFFFTMFENYLNGYKEKDVPNAEVNHDLFVIHYNAWENDFWDNAFEPLIYRIFSDEKFNNCFDAKYLEGAVKGIAGAVLKLTKGFFLKRIEDTFGDDAAEYFDDKVVGNFKNFLSGKADLFKEYREFKEGVDEFKIAIRDYIDLLGSNKKLIVIVDELDRCKPTYAIQTLEIVKHFFDIDNLVFLFAVDLEQLGHAIKTVYGNDMDTMGYLARFFDFISKLPSIKYDSYILNCIEKIDYCLKKDMNAFFQEIISAFDLSIRDIDIITKNYQIMMNHFLKEYEAIGAHYIYVFYLTLKYKNPSVYNDLFIKNLTRRQNARELLTKNYGKLAVGNTWIRSTISYFGQNELLCELIIKPYCNEKGESNYRAGKIIRVEHDIVYINYEHGTEKFQIVGLSDFSNIMFYNDLRKWNRIKDVTYLEYIKSQLDVYSFYTDNTTEEDKNE